MAQESEMTGLSERGEVAVDPLNTDVTKSIDDDYTNYQRLNDDEGQAVSTDLRERAFKDGISVLARSIHDECWQNRH